MNGPPSLETVCQAINALYHNPESSGKEKASLWLGELQHSVRTLSLFKKIFGCYFKVLLIYKYQRSSS